MCVWELEKKKQKQRERLMKERKAELNFRNHAVKSFFFLIYLFIYLLLFIIIIYLFIYLFIYFLFYYLFIVYASPFREIIIQVYR